MQDASQELQRIDWSACFPFTRIFQTFRVATQPNMLLLGLGAILLTGVSGAVFDWIWMQRHEPVAMELHAYWQTSDIDEWRDGAYASQAWALHGIQEQMMGPEESMEDLEAFTKRFRSAPQSTWNEVVNRLEEKYADARQALLDDPDLAEEDRPEAIARMAREYNARHAALKELRPGGVFRSFLGFYTEVVGEMLASARDLNFTGRLQEVLAGSEGSAAFPPGAELRGIGVVSGLVLIVRAKQWMFLEHPFYAILFGLDVLVIWSLFGGAICRMAALNVAREERISMKSALAFSTRKFVCFASVPILLMIVIGVLALLMALWGLVGILPLGDLIVSILMFVALAGGFVASILIIGGAVGSPLWWPTVAVEGSDGFDAITRSYSYTLPRPWHAAFYAAVAFVYGSICYLFVRFLVWLILCVTHLFVGFSMNLAPWKDYPGTGDVDAGKLDAMWQMPTFEKLAPTAPPFGMEWSFLGLFEIGSAKCIHVWVFLLVMLMCAFLVTFYFSASTIIYFLLRQRVDAIDFEDVYLDEDLDGEDYAYATDSAPAGEGVSLPVVEGGGSASTESGDSSDTKE